MANPESPVIEKNANTDSIEIQREETLLSWSHVYVECYPKISILDRIRRKKKSNTVLLSDLSGIARPGEILAVMGTSGVGKTTLLNYLSGQNDPRSTIGRGDVHINGHLMNRQQRQNGSSIGHVQQHEPFLNLLSLEEHLIFQAMLRMHKLPNDEARRQAVSKMISLLSLDKCRDTLIGRLSGGEKKRLAFGSVLLSDPSVVLIDEPTSGLDLYLAKRLMNIIAKMAVEQRRTLIVVLHQPTSEMFAHINSLCLLVHGGRQAYFGRREDAVDYFSIECKIPGTSLENYIEQLAAPPDSGEEALHKGSIAADCYEGSSISKNLDDEISILALKPIGSPPAGSERSWHMGLGRQIKWLLWRIWLDFRRNPKRVIFLGIRLMIMAILFGVLLFQIKPQDTGYARNMTALFFLMVSALCESNMSILIVGMITERPVIIHDYKRRMYSIPAYYLTRLATDFIYGIITSIMYTGVIIAFVGFYRPFLSIVTVTLDLLAAVSMSALIATSASSTKMALILLQPIYLSIAQFSGYYMNSSTMPVYISWLQYVSFYYYYFHLMLIIQWTNFPCAGYESIPSPTNSTISTEVCKYTGKNILQYYVANPKDFGLDISMLIVLIVVVQCISFTVNFIRLKRAA